MKNLLRRCKRPHVAALALLLPACAPPATVVAPVSAACLTPADSTVPVLDTVIVALTLAQGERFLARHMNANLVGQDCTGALRPELATRWDAEDGGKSWVFTLRSVAAGGATAGKVRDTWDAQRNGGIWPWPAILDVEVMDSLRLRVRLDRSYADLPAEFADPRLGVSGGAFRFLSHYRAPTPAGPVITITTLAPASGRGPVIRVEVLRPNVDARDALDLPRMGPVGPADVVIASDAATVEYARRRPELTVVPIAWSPTYVLLTPAPGSLATTLAMSDDTRRGLVRDVVPGEVRRAEPPFWWEGDPCLSTASARIPDPRDGPILGFQGGDPVARALAERLSAVAMTKAGPRPIATGRMDSLRTIRPPNALVVPLPRRRPVSCNDVIQWPAGSAIDPLVDLRTFVILRRGVQPLLLDGDGMVRFSPVASR